MRLKLVGDGRPGSTAVVCATTGEVLDGLEAVDLSLDAVTNHLTCTLTLSQIVLDLQTTRPLPTPIVHPGPAPTPAPPAPVGADGHVQRLPLNLFPV